MNSANRRGFLKIAGAGAAVAGAATLSPAGSVAYGSTPGAPAATKATRLPAGATGSIVAYVHDVSNGEVAVMIAGREFTMTDHELVARLATAVHTAAATTA